ncbi:MAG: 50S ribosomal protein L11 methyltransferase, partial [Magnetococcales bacterium]|nr:50S ribosomal protein L11 methyltransferase [Magnetococcales bacterium]
IWAAMLGAEGVTATDLDPVAVETALRNCRLNGVAARVAVREVGEVPAGRFATIVANILAGVLIDLAEPLAAALAPGGRMILSGILQNQAAEVEKAFAGRGLQQVQWRPFEEWAVLVFRKEIS